MRNGGRIIQPQEIDKMSDTASGSARILIAEDDESNRKVTSAMLKHLGYSVDAVSNGKEVLTALDRQPYDIILMNLRMPEMSGLEATRQIRNRYPLNMQPKIIAYTATAIPECRDTCLKAGMNDFVAKPVKMGDLAKTLSKHLHLSLKSNEEPPLRLTSLMDLERQQTTS